MHKDGRFDDFMRFQIDMREITNHTHLHTHHPCNQSNILPGSRCRNKYTYSPAASCHHLATSLTTDPHQSAVCNHVILKPRDDQLAGTVQGGPLAGPEQGLGPRFLGDMGSTV